MGLNKPVNFLAAKLLKEKGLKLNFCREVFYENPNVKGEFVRIEMNHDWELIENRDWYSAPTIVEVIMWLYEKHDIWIYIQPQSLIGLNKDRGADNWYYTIIHCDRVNSNYYGSPTEAYQEAIEYVLKNLL